MNLNDYNYVHMGTDYITKELWVDIMQMEGPKPIGGLWTSPFNNIPGSISDWSDLLLEKTDLMYGHPYKKGCLIKINPNCRICFLDSGINLDKIKQIHHMNSSLDYEKLAKLYDALFISPFCLPTEFRKWKVRTLLLSNLDIIDSYIPVSIKLEQNAFYIDKMGQPCKVDDVSDDYIELTKKIEKLFDQYLNEHYDTDLKKAIEQGRKAIYSSLSDQIENRINPRVDNYYIIDSILLNEKHKQYRKRK